ncbi:ketosynthase chain-length factor [Actinocrispum wychmicini]|uniref:Act minimal PKS chain-length factor (CLF/KS beta) n=1 Tax=Actinocrispum wychmicini TaxID=1213861 RepID=A0A4R2JPF1_9PSEU|nr:ketosynthase chain-length factor [Actinocrispum wychmicini]TCO62033.1 act minimal PKS chain-length factor (CLF/KS beta) [Actinocrispum wychmicini]
MTRAVVTGIGVLAPTGLGLDSYWAATLRGSSALAQVTRLDPGRYPAKIAGEIPYFDPGRHLPGRLVPQMDRMTQLALTAADWAMADAKIDGEFDELSAGVTTAGTFGGFEFGQRELQNLWRAGPKHVSVYMSFAWFYAVNSGQISIRQRLRGPTGVFVGEQAGGLEAIAQARRNIAKGCTIMLTGGMESSLCPYSWVAHEAGGRVSHSHDPKAAYVPFTGRANGYVPGEGGAILVVEEADAARERGAGEYGEIAGYASTFDPPAGSARPPGLRRCAALAMADAGIDPSDVDVVFADGMGVAELDSIEALAITEIFGPHGVPVALPKTGVGRLFSGGAPLDVATALLALRDRLLPPAPNISAASVCADLDVVTETPRPCNGRHALVLARGAGGFNAALVVRAPAAGTDSEGEL